jgi:hypothetical protein
MDTFQSVLIVLFEALPSGDAFGELVGPPAPRKTSIVEKEAHREKDLEDIRRDFFSAYCGRASCH